MHNWGQPCGFIVHCQSFLPVYQYSPALTELREVDGARTVRVELPEHLQDALRAEYACRVTFTGLAQTGGMAQVWTDDPELT